MKISLNLLVTFALFSFCSEIVYSQLSKSSSLLGLRTSGIYMDFYDESKSEWKNYYQIRFEPYYMFFIKNNWGIGIMGEMEFIGGKNLGENFFPETRNIYGVGPITRYYYPLKIDRGFFRRIKFYSESSLTITNYYQTKEKSLYVSNGNLKNSILRFRPAGLSFQLFKGLNLELSPVIYKYFPGRWRFGMNFGFEYHFNKEKSK